MNKRKLRSIVFLLLLLPASAQLQTIPFLGTKTPYPVPVNNKISAPPTGYKPVFINYTGRHGARFMTKAGADLELLQVLAYAEQQNGLSELGRKFKQMADRFLQIQKAGYENITLLGASEQEGIGSRLQKNYQPAFSGKGIDVSMTYKVRTQQSAEAFLKGLTDYTGEKRKKIIPEADDNTLRFYDLSPAYQDFKKSDLLKKKLDSLQADSRTAEACNRICSKVFTPEFAKKIIDKGISIEVKNKPVLIKGDVFAADVFEVYTMQFSIPGEMKAKGYSAADIDFKEAFETNDLSWFNFTGGAQDFLEKGSGLDTLGIQVRVAIPLLADYLNSTQQLIDHKINTDGIFRFTHAEAISPFATLLGIREASQPAASIFKYAEHWKASSIIPLSANICWVVYSNGKDWLVKITLNEKEVALPIATRTYPFYRWEDIKKYYTQKMAKLGVSPNQDMQKYLQDLK